MYKENKMSKKGKKKVSMKSMRCKKCPAPGKKMPKDMPMDDGMM